MFMDFIDFHSFSISVSTQNPRLLASPASVPGVCAWRWKAMFSCLAVRDFITHDLRENPPFRWDSMGFYGNIL